MDRKMVMAFAPLTEKQREQIAAKAEKKGFRAVFCTNPDEALKEAKDAEIVMSLDKRLAKAGPNLKWFCTPSAGVDHVLGELEGTDILLSNSSGAYGVTIAEHIVMTALEVMRNRPEYIRLKEERVWKQNLPVRSLYGATVTFLGTGDIGQEAARRIRAFAPKSLIGVNRHGSNPEQLFDRIVPLSGLNRVLKKTDLLIMGLPSTKETRGIMSAERLAMLPQGAFVVNVGRGDAIDQKALEEMLRNGTLGGAALDVFKKEPLPKESTLWDCPRLILTTHVAGNWTLPLTVEKIVAMFLEDFDRYCKGLPLKRLVDRRIGYKQSETIARVREMEELFDRALALNKKEKKSAREEKELCAAAARLKEYYESPLWREDFEADEAGRLPKDLKRGVLSEDGIYDLLDEL
ncbi:MAG: DUF4298 domain-containing protein [Lachnospiraceae bacterium]|nr:DUF4298 domain-containing protein [Lachnospiraceae bacterium]MBO4697684.1 DUF4298 domain-containing protein [Lachnospiraceae bacterium]